jgi:hypothetical protein
MRDQTVGSYMKSHRKDFAIGIARTAPFPAFIVWVARRVVGVVPFPKAMGFGYCVAYGFGDLVYVNHVLIVAVTRWI